MSVFQGAERIQKAEATRPARRGRPTKADLLAQAAAIGLEIPDGATNAQIVRLIQREAGG